MLISGTVIGLCTAVLVLTGIELVTPLFLCAVSAFIIFLIKPFNLKNKIAIPVVCFSVAASCLFFSIYHFGKVTPALKLDNTTTNVSGKIITVPTKTEYSTEFTLKSYTVGDNSQSTKIQVSLPSDCDINLQLFDYITLTNAQLSVVRNEYNKPDPVAMGDGIILEASASDIAVLWECDRTPFYYCLKLKEAVREQMNAYLPEEDAGFLLGMLFGDKTQLDSNISSDFRNTGISHLLAVSGLHTSTWCAYIIAILTLLKFKEKLRNVFCILFLCALCTVSAFTPSVMRASIMTAVLLIAPFFNEEADSLNSLGIAVAVLTLSNPYIITTPSFLLSVFATLGVLASVSFFTKIRHKIPDVKFTCLQKPFDCFLSSLISTVFAGLFTLPISAYFFGVFGVISPLANLLCVKPAFWSLLAGVSATAVSFFSGKLPQTFCIWGFKVSTALAHFVTHTANSLSKIKFCTVPIHGEYFILGLAVIVTIVLLWAFLRSESAKKPFGKISVILSITVLFMSVALPCTDITPAVLSVVNVSDGLNVSLRQGLNYAYFSCGSDISDPDFSDCLPSAKCENLKFLYIADSNSSTDGLTGKLTALSPKSSVITEYAKANLNESNITLPENTLIADSFTCKFNREITVQTVDTYPISCVIIKSNKKLIMLCYGENSDIELLFDTYGTPDVLVLSRTLPEKLPKNVNTLIISSNSKLISQQNILSLKKQCEKYYSTPEDGNIKIIL